jgi:hypothetical protein
VSAPRSLAASAMLRIDFRGIFGVVGFSTFATKSAKSGSVGATFSEEFGERGISTGRQILRYKCTFTLSFARFDIQSELATLRQMAL